MLRIMGRYDHDPASLNEIEQWYNEKLLANWPVIVAENEGVVIAYGSYGLFNFKNTVEHKIHIAECYLHTGIEQLLLTQLAAFAKNQGYEMAETLK